MYYFDLKRQKTYDALIRAFEELMQEKTVDTLTVRELCQRASIGRNTFYSHFEDKYAFLQYYISLCKESIEASAARWKDDFIQYQITIAAESFRFLSDHRFLWDRNITAPSSCMLQDMIKNHIRILLINELNSQEDRTGLHITVSKELLASFYAGGLLELFMEGLSNDRITEEEISRYLQVF